MRRRICSAMFLAAAACTAHLFAAEDFIPRRQTKPPNEPYSPAEAIAKMTVPEGFTVELVAAEPDLVNPVAMTFDERGRIWVTESLEYPRKSPGPGRDRVKILEDTDGDGAVDKVSIFADGLNIPSGIAVGHGGVWVANAPDILFYPDADHDGVADGPPQKVVTGFGRADTHELPNSLTWGPDGYLYGLNGVFNPSKIVQNGRTFEFTCAMFRIDPRTREFGLFCEGTSNPWGIAFNDVGDAFVSACVIDHLWHFVETGYYHRQGGAYPPFTWKLGSIVDYKHQMAAYCGIHWFDSDAYPEQYRQKLYMGNVHGGCINVDRLERNGATYRGKPEPDFLTANDAWFMPVVQKTGPDGCLYILDWYDRYHCYQDANYDPAGVDRAKGRLYRVRYQNTPRAPKFDLHAETDDQLIERLGSPNVFYRDLAQRLLAERNDAATRKKLEKVVLDSQKPLTFRMHSLWSLISAGPLEPVFHYQLFGADNDFISWAIRALGDMPKPSGLVFPELFAKIHLQPETAPEIRLQAAIAWKKIHGKESAGSLLRCCGVRESDRDSVIHHIVWQNILATLPESKADIIEAMSHDKDMSHRSRDIIPHFINWLLAQGETGAVDVAKLIQKNLRVGSDQEATAGLCLDIVARKLQSGELTGKAEKAFRTEIEPNLQSVLEPMQLHPLHDHAVVILSFWGNRLALAYVENNASDRFPDERRMRMIDAWAATRDQKLIAALPALFKASNSIPLRLRVLDAITKRDDPEIAKFLLEIYPELDAALRPATVELLTSRVAWSNQLLDAIAAGTVPKDAVNVNQIGKLLKSGDKELAARVEQTWGKLRTDRNPQREQVVAEMRKLLVGSQGDPHHGQVVFMKLCGQCHKLHGQGQDVGPDITGVGRASFEQLLSNVFDPSLVIGPAYQGRTVVTADGRVLTGLVVEDNPQRIVLKLQGGKLETIARGDVDDMEVSKLSLMPEGVEKQLSPQELIDLFALLKLDKPPTDPHAKPLPGFTELK